MASYKQFIIELAKQYNPQNEEITSEFSIGNYDDVFSDGMTKGEAGIFRKAKEFLESTKKSKEVVTV